MFKSNSEHDLLELAFERPALIEKEIARELFV